MLFFFIKDIKNSISLSFRFFIMSTNKNKGLIPEESLKQDRLVLLYLTRTASLELDSLP
jgi:hypothetical protein